MASGTYAVSREKKNETLVAHLGTCVGIALCDRRAKVGGLIHLLLPEPTGIDKPWQPVSYATTGAPLFLEALMDLGGEQSQPGSHRGGGALVGQVSQRDLNLDIGGRFTCTLRLDLKTWDNCPSSLC